MELVKTNGNRAEGELRKECKNDEIATPKGKKTQQTLCYFSFSI